MSKQLISNKELIDLWKKGLEQREQQCLEKVRVFTCTCIYMYLNVQIYLVLCDIQCIIMLLWRQCVNAFLY